MSRRILKYVLYGGSVVGLTTLAVTTNYQDLALVRMGRSAITAVDVGYTYKSKLYSTNLDKDTEEYRALKSETHKIAAEKILKLCRKNKGAYIKIGQHVGAMDYLLPSEYVHTMRVLHKDAPQNSVDQLYKVIREDLRIEPKEVFCEFDKEPLGTASLAQVHRAKLKDGRVVAVKVQHYFVRKNIHTDIKIIDAIVKVMSRVFPDFQLHWLVDETKKNIMKELNFVNEGKNAEKVSDMFKDYSWLKIPKIVWDYTSERVLVMEYVQGGLVNDVQYIKEHKIDRFDLSRKLGDLYSHMIFVKGFVHSDPHPGNILVHKQPTDKNTTVYLLDHGLYAELSEQFRYDYSKFWLSIINRERDEMKKYAERLGIRGELYGLFACIVTGRPWDSIMKGIDKTKPSKAEKSTFQTELPHFLPNITECLEQVDRQALLVFKTNDLIRSIEYALHTQDQLCGFMVMTKCCRQAVYTIDYRNTNSAINRTLLNIGYGWSLLTFYLYGVFLTLRSVVAAES